MDILFENTHLFDEAFIKEFTRNSYLKRPMMIIYYILLALALAMGVALYALQGLTNLTLFIFLYVPLCLLMTYIRYRRAISVTVSRMKEVNGGTPEESRTQVFEDKLKILSPRGETDFSLDVFKSASFSKNYLFLRSKARQVVAFSKTGVTQGDMEGLVQFLESKGISVRGDM